MSKSDSTTLERPGQVNEVDAIRALGEALNGYLKPNLDEGRVVEIVDEHIAQARMPRQIELKIAGRDDAVVLTDRTHRQFDELLELVAEGHPNILLVGPAGTGKTTLAKHVAQALQRDFAFLSLSMGVTEVHLFGRILPQTDGSWTYTPSRFVQVYENGGIFLLDEIDSADPNVMVAINAALANGCLANPVNGQIHHRHPDCIIVAAANTYGLGGSTMYVGRNQLDAATLDRFVMSTMFVDYDTGLEQDSAQAVLDREIAFALIEWVTLLRDRVASYKIRRVVSTRLVIGAVAALKAGRTLDRVKARFFQSWSADEKAKVGE